MCYPRLNMVKEGVSNAAINASFSGDAGVEFLGGGYFSEPVLDRGTTRALQ